MAKNKKILSPVFFMITLTAVCTLSLALLNEATAPIIERQMESEIQKAIFYAVGEDISPNAIKERFSQHFVYKDQNVSPHYVYSQNGELSGYVFPFSGKGLWGSISGYLAFNSDFTKLLGIEFVNQSETPGLGGRIEESWYKEQFRSLSLHNDPPIILRPSANGNIDSITGATLTGTAVKEMLNTFIEEIKMAAKEGYFNE